MLTQTLPGHNDSTLQQEFQTLDTELKKEPRSLLVNDSNYIPEIMDELDYSFCLSEN